MARPLPPPLPLLMARSLVEDFFCGFPYQFHSLMNADKTFCHAILRSANHFISEVDKLVKETDS